MTLVGNGGREALEGLGENARSSFVAEVFKRRPRVLARMLTGYVLLHTAKEYSSYKMGNEGQACKETSAKRCASRHRYSCSSFSQGATV